MKRRVLWWFRGKDLRIEDHPFFETINPNDEIVPLFVVDPYFFAPERAQEIPHRIQFLLESLEELKVAIHGLGSELIIREGKSADLIPQLAKEWKIDQVFCCRWVEPFGRERDRRIADCLKGYSIPMTLLEGETLFPPGSVRNGSGQMFRVFTPFSKVCWSRGIQSKEPPSFSLPPLPEDIEPHSISVPSLTQLKIERNPNVQKGGSSEGKKILHTFLTGPVSNYSSMRDRMDQRGTSRLSAHIKFGTLSIRSIWKMTIASGLTEASRKFLNELLWREFSHHMLWEWPELVSTPFRKDFKDFPYLNNQADWEAWKEGKTGYPIIDAAARELLSTGYVHNRARMISASFLTKHLLIDYRLGEQHYLKYLTDGDWAQNNAGWQWSAGCGCDAQPWFRIFNPITQALKFDPSGEYVRKYIPELSNVSNEWIHTPWLAPNDQRDQWNYPNPIIGLDEGRQRFLAAAKMHLKRDTP